jgi:hypothetical protein
MACFAGRIPSAPLQDGTASDSGPHGRIRIRIKTQRGRIPNMPVWSIHPRAVANLHDRYLLSTEWTPQHLCSL